jgi:hypothetical protein
MEPAADLTAGTFAGTNAALVPDGVARVTAAAALRKRTAAVHYSYARATPAASSRPAGPRWIDAHERSMPHG